VRPLAVVILIVTAFFLFTSHPSLAQSSVPKGLDPTIQLFSVTRSDINVPKPSDFTRIQSAQDAEGLLTTFNVALMKRADLCASGRAILIHTAEWLITPPPQQGTPPTAKGDFTFSLNASQWTGFSAKYKNSSCKLTQSFRADKNPLFYGHGSIYLIAINYFADGSGRGVDPNQFQMGYKVSTTASTPQNEQDLGTLVAALVGFTLPSSAGSNFIGTLSEQGKASPEQLPHYFILTQLISPTAPAPYTINVAPVMQPGTSTLPKATAEEGYFFDLSDKAGRGNSITDVQNLPAGLSFDNKTSVISGTPHAAAVGDEQVTLEINTVQGLKDFAVTLPVRPSKPDTTGTAEQPTKQGTQNTTTSPSQPVDCAKVTASSPCTFTRNFPVDDKEYWDISLGLAIPGPKENVFKSSSSGLKPTSSPTTHTDAYALADFYFLAHYWPKVSYAPHLNGGIPITSQSLHRPYVGVAEDISPWFQRHGFPLDLCFFGGIVFMKQQLYDPSSPTLLRTDWALKTMYGVEVPISSITSKLSGKGNKSSSGSKANSGGQ
jgi:hypothetical protein